MFPDRRAFLGEEGNTTISQSTRQNLGALPELVKLNDMGNRIMTMTVILSLIHHALDLGVLYKKPSVRGRRYDTPP